MRSVLAVALLCLLVLSACGAGESPSLDVPALVARTITASSEEESVRLAMRIESDFDGKLVRIEADGVSAADQSRGRYDGLYVEGGKRVRMDMLMTEGALYFRGKAFEAALPPGKTWLRMPDDTPAAMTPAEFVEFLREADDVEDAGREEIRGTPTVHLRGPLDIGQLVEDTSSESARYFKRIPGAEEFDATIDAWISEEDDRLKRLGLVLTHPGASGSMRMTTDVLEYGVSLEGAEPPDPSTVFDG